MGIKLLLWVLSLFYRPYYFSGLLLKFLYIGPLIGHLGKPHENHPFTGMTPGIRLL